MPSRRREGGGSWGHCLGRNRGVRGTDPLQLRLHCFVLQYCFITLQHIFTFIEPACAFKRSNNCTILEWWTFQLIFCLFLAGAKTPVCPASPERVIALPCQIVSTDSSLSGKPLVCACWCLVPTVETYFRWHQSPELIIIWYFQIFAFKIFTEKQPSHLWSLLRVVLLCALVDFSSKWFCRASDSDWEREIAGGAGSARGSVSLQTKPDPKPPGFFFFP